MPRSNPGSTAISAYSVWITSGHTAIWTFLIPEKCLRRTLNGPSPSWFGVPLMTTTRPAAEARREIISIAVTTSSQQRSLHVFPAWKISPGTRTNSGFSFSTRSASASRHRFVSSERRFTPSFSGPLKFPICQSPE